MPHDLPKAYDPTAIEDKWAEYWVRENLFTQPTPAEASSKPAEGYSLDGRSPFTILLPPPNVTGRLHMGHMLNQTEMDILTRWHRMKGDPTLWLPGTDHAGIATQMMVERQVTAEGTSRQALGREKFLERVWCWRKQYGGAILEQMKRLGASVDWQREYFTMDANLSVAVREAFTRLYHQGLIYRGAYVVNWCPGCQTAVSDLEVIHEEVLGSLWEIRYPVVGSEDEFLTIATTRPETLLGDVAVAIHPEDERYLHLHGKKLLLPLMNREIPIILDDWVSRDFGTGAVKVTPAHDPNDFALGQRHNLPSISVMDDTAHINENGGPYAGLSRFQARKQVLADLEELGLLGTVHDHKLSIGRCDRSKDIIEPRLSTQWFVAVNKQPTAGTCSHGSHTMAEVAVAAVTANAEGEKPIRFTPSMYEKTYLNWMANIYDWCISRQLWWGHRIPAWHCAVCHQITVPKPGDAANPSVDPSACAHCNSSEIAQETDVLDTWFSSALLPVSVFGWPFLENEGKPTADFDSFFPTSLLVTGFDILFFWVERMIMMCSWFALDVPKADGARRELKDAVPFKEVYIHALVRDANREKMSKTKGNVIDPIEIVKQYGTDAVRFTLASMASPGTDIAFNVARTEGYRAFANKIWNAARFIFMNLDRAKETGIVIDSKHFGVAPKLTKESPLEARWIVAELYKTSAEVHLCLEDYRFDQAASTIYQFFWNFFCDWYLEIVKLRLDFSETADRAATEASLTTLVQVFEVALRLLSPLMPFITEEIWHALYDGNPPVKSIALTQYPEKFKANWNLNATTPMRLMQEMIIGIRAYRKDAGVPEKEEVPVLVVPGSKHARSFRDDLLAQNKQVILKLSKTSELTEVGVDNPERTKFNWRSIGWADIAVVYDKQIDVAAERERLTKEVARLEKAITNSERQLTNQAFLEKAPPSVVEGLKKQEAENRQLLEKAKAALDTLPPDAA